MNDHEDPPTYAELELNQTKKRARNVFAEVNPETAMGKSLREMREPMSVEDYERFNEEPAVQKIPGVSYADADRSNAPVSLHLDSLEQRLRNLEMLLRGVQLAIEPILGPREAPAAHPDGGVRNASPLVQRIAEIDDMVLNLNDRVEEMLARVEV